MEDDIKTPILITFGMFVLIGALGITIRFCSVADTKYVEPVAESARRDVYENTKSYRDGTKRDLEELYLSYVQAKTPEDKAAILSVMQHRAESAPPDVIPPAVQALLNK